MSAQRKRERHLEVLELRAEGREAALLGRPRQTNRHQYSNRLQWNQGYDDAMLEKQRAAREYGKQRERDELRALIRSVIEEWWAEREEQMEAPGSEIVKDTYGEGD